MSSANPINPSLIRSIGRVARRHAAIGLVSMVAMGSSAACSGAGMGEAATLRFSGESFRHEVTVPAGGGRTSLRLALDDDTGMHIGGVPDGVRVSVTNLHGVERGSSSENDGAADLLLYTTSGGAATLEFERIDDSTEPIVFDARFNACMNMVDEDGELGVCS